MRHRSLSFSSLAITTLSALVATSAQGGFTGVCPDGSMFIVQRREAIPCKDAKLVEPDEMPPLRPQYLPRPYAWQKFNQRNDPNNPYNLIDAGEGGLATETAAGSPGRSRPAPQAQRPPVSAPPSAPVELGFSEQEIRDLASIVGLSQQVAPAEFTRSTRDGRPGLTLRLAHSQAFEAALRATAWHGPGDGPVVLFAAEASAPEAFYANLTFVQGHVAFHPDPEDPGQLGMLRGALGELGAGEALLGYAVLPDRVDLSRPLDIYWNDQRLATTLRP